MNKVKENELNKENIEDTNENMNEPKESIITEDANKDSKEIIEEKDLSQEVVQNNMNKNEISLENLTKKSHKKTIIITLIIIFVILLLLFLSTIFALVNCNSTTIVSGTSIKGIDISGMTKEEAFNKVSDIVNSKLTSSFELIHNDYSTTVTAEQFSANYDIESSINTAYNIGKSSNIFKNNFDIITSLLFKINIVPSFSYNEDTVNSLITEIESNLPDRLVEPSYYIEDKNLIIVKGTDGITIDTDLLKFKIISNINNFNSTNKNIDIPVKQSKASDININNIYNDIYKEAKDAYFTQNPFTIYPQVDGVDFEISIDEAKAMLEQEQDTYTIPLKITKPSITTNDIGEEAFPNLLATFSTTYSTKNSNRSTNISLASKKINGVVLMPGEVFSYNSTVGKRTAAAGFKEAAVYSGGEVTTGIGGGICQVSSTLYNSVLLANLEIVERFNHGFNPGYVKAGTDATVSWGGPDFKFKNNRNYPIKIVCNGSGGTITTKIYGLKEENEFEVEIQAYITSYIPYSTITKQDPSLPVRNN